MRCWILVHKLHSIFWRSWNRACTLTQSRSASWIWVKSWCRRNVSCFFGKLHTVAEIGIVQFAFEFKDGDLNNDTIMTTRAQICLGQMRSWNTWLLTVMSNDTTLAEYLRSMYAELVDWYCEQTIILVYPGMAILLECPVVLRNYSSG